MERGVSSGSSSSGRYETFTEAVPLALSSMAHHSLPLEHGLLDGVRQVLSHTLLSCVNYARIQHPPHGWTFRDLTTSDDAWTTLKGEENPSDLPFSLQKLKFQHQYCRTARIYLKPHAQMIQMLSQTTTADTEEQHDNNWTLTSACLGRVTLLYVSKEPLTQGEMDGTDTEDMPHTILYKVLVEYRSLPATGNQQAVQAEELSMLSFGGSVDDDVKYGALAVLCEPMAKYVLEIFSVRGKKYKFDLMDSTLNDGTVPRLPTKCEGESFVKCLCATVIDHGGSATDGSTSSSSRSTAETTSSTSNSSNNNNNKDKYAITRLQLTLEGKPRQSLDSLPKFDYMVSAIKESFLQLNPDPPLSVSASPSGHTLLLDPAMAGHVYVNGRYVTTWGRDARIGSHGVALFGMDLRSIPFWQGTIVDYEALKTAYGQLWHEILVDARLLPLNMAARLMLRLMRGYDQDQDEHDLYDDDEDKYADVSVDCLESQILGSGEYDRVGIAAKALATRFNIEFGVAAFPCLEHDVAWAKSALPGREPVVVPQRLLHVLRRGGHFDVKRTSDELWRSDVRPAREGGESETVAAALQLLKSAGCLDVQPSQIVFCACRGVEDAIAQKTVCQYFQAGDEFLVQERFLQLGFEDLAVEEVDTFTARAFLLGMYIAQAHPDGQVLARYLLRNKK
jgi:hypothetical protein